MRAALIGNIFYRGLRAIAENVRLQIKTDIKKDELIFQHVYTIV